MSTEKSNELFRDRLEKLKKLQEMGVDPYPCHGVRTNAISDLVENFKSFLASEKTITVAGRLKALRGHGKLVFADLEDESGSIQIVIKMDSVGEKEFEIFRIFDIGDFIQVSGKLFLTQKQEKTILAEKFSLLTKSLRALPEKFHGLKDQETLLRQRYLDMIVNPEIRGMFYKKSLFWRTVREFLAQEGFLEVETPVLEHVPGGAEAEPFITRYNALDQDFYLRISLELPLKRLLVGGFEKVFEVGRIFRNEGVSAEHLQDYTQMEFYWAYADYNDLQKMLPRLYREIVNRLFGTTEVMSKEKKLDWGKEWEVYDYYEVFKKHTGFDLNDRSEKTLKALADKQGIKYEKFASIGRLIDQIYKKAVRPHLINPGFLLDPPVEVEPLAKRLIKDPARVQRLQIMAWGTELGKGFSELNDPLDQRRRFEEQMSLRAAGDKEAQQLDEDFLEALEYGMPPAAGFGMSERFFATLMDKPIRETVIFPPMKTEKDL